MLLKHGWNQNFIYSTQETKIWWIMVLSFYLILVKKWQCVVIGQI